MCVRVLSDLFSSHFRFITVYNGPCHTYKVQRLNESTAYYFKIQACNDAGEGDFSEVYAFATTKSPPPAVKGEGRLAYINGVHKMEPDLTP